MCLGVWSRLGFVKDSDVKKAMALPEIPADAKEGDLSDGWDSILY
jgi:hypothetical protein